MVALPGSAMTSPARSSRSKASRMGVRLTPSQASSSVSFSLSPGSKVPSTIRGPERFKDVVPEQRPLWTPASGERACNISYIPLPSRNRAGECNILHFVRSPFDREQRTDDGHHRFRALPADVRTQPHPPAARLSAHLGGAQIWAKREDCNSGLAYGGNKTRKLEYLVPDALAPGADTLVSIGGYQSNHTRQVAAVAAKLGLKAGWCRRTGSTGRTRSTTGSATSCCRGSWVPTSGWTRRGLRHRRSSELGDSASRTSWPLADAVPDPGRRVRPPLGGLGFANWADEVEQQERELGIFFDTIVVCTVTGSTQAGMIAGFAGQDRPRRVIGIDASAKLEETRDQVERIARDTAELIGLGRELRDDEITVLEGWAGDLYGIPVASTLEAIRLGGRSRA